MTIPGGYTAGDVLTAANCNLLPAGVVGYAEKTANQTGITSIVDVSSLTVTWTAVASRRYRTSFVILVGSTVLDDVATIRITDSSNNVKQDCALYCRSTTVVTATLCGSVVETGLSGSTTRKLRAVRTAGSGTMEIAAAATYPAYILVEDIGPA